MTGYGTDKKVPERKTNAADENISGIKTTT
jgi:hypothetical protein